MGAAPFLSSQRWYLRGSTAVVAHATPVVNGTLGLDSRAIRKLREVMGAGSPWINLGQVEGFWGSPWLVSGCWYEFAKFIDDQDEESRRGLW
jgi:hypothetical protein